MVPKFQILTVDDDEDINHMLANYLVPYGFVTHVASNADNMRRQLTQHSIDLIVMDVMLPGTDGLSLTRELKQQNSPIPVIMLTARSDHFDRVLGLESGADDYVTKPFEPRELVARIQAVLRRAAAPEKAPESNEGNVIRFNGWQLNTENHSLQAPSGVTVALSNAEFRLLCSFLHTPQHLFSRDQLIKLAHGHVAGAGGRSIDLLVSRLRQKLTESPDGPDMIKTIRGHGYLFSAPVERGQAT
jgi:two-component system OmpR family response regulator